MSPGTSVPHISTTSQIPVSYRPQPSLVQSQSFPGTNRTPPPSIGRPMPTIYPGIPGGIAPSLVDPGNETQFLSRGRFLFGST